MDCEHSQSCSLPLEELLEGQPRGVAALSCNNRVQNSERLHLLLHDVRVEGTRLVLEIGAYATHKVHAQIRILAEHSEQGQAGVAEVGRHGAQVVHLRDAASAERVEILQWIKC